jgi:hypothetical protein
MTQERADLDRPLGATAGPRAKPQVTGVGNSQQNARQTEVRRGGVTTTASAQDVRRERFERGVLNSRSTAPEGQPIAFQLLILYPF